MLHILILCNILFSDCYVVKFSNDLAAIFISILSAGNMLNAGTGRGQVLFTLLICRKIVVDTIHNLFFEIHIGYIYCIDIY